MKKKYELTILSRIDSKVSEFKQYLDKITKDRNIKLDIEEVKENYSLAYPILEQDKATFYYGTLYGDEEDVKEVIQIFNINEDVLRYLLVISNDNK